MPKNVQYNKIHNNPFTFKFQQENVYVEGFLHHTGAQQLCIFERGRVSTSGSTEDRSKS